MVVVVEGVFVCVVRRVENCRVLYVPLDTTTVRWGGCGLRGMGYGVCGVWCVVCGVWSVACNAWYVVCVVWYVVCDVLCECG